MLEVTVKVWYRLTWVVPDKGPLNGCVWVNKMSYLYLTVLQAADVQGASGLDYCKSLLPAAVMGPSTSTIDDDVLQEMFSTASCFLGCLPPAPPLKQPGCDWYAGAGGDVLLAQCC